MYKEYIDTLMQTIHATQFSSEDGQICGSYEEAMEHLIEIFTWVKRQGKTTFFIGNGGSAAIASHMTADFMKNGGMKTYSLYDNSVTTCMGNDYGYESIFSRPLEFLLNEDDLLVAISSSGNSANIINAVNVAKKKRANIITFSGFENDNKLKHMGKWNVYVPKSHYGMVESIHIVILQQIVDMIMERDGVQL